MALTITGLPKVNVNGNINTVSRWLSVNNPINFTLHREDATFTSIQANSSTQATINSTGIGTTYSATVTAPFEITIAGSDFPDGVYTALSINTNTIVIDITGMGYSGATPPFSAGYLNITRENYHIKTRVRLESLSGTILGINVSRIDSQYNSIIDVSTYLKSALAYTEDYNFTTRNTKDRNLGNIFNLEFSENWTGYEGGYDVQLPNDYYFINSVQQLGSQYSGNMGEFVPFDDSDYDPADTKAKFLCDFETPTYFTGYPFSIDFIFNNLIDLATYTVNRKEIRYNVNNVATGNSSEALIEDGVKYVNRLKNKQNYDPTAVRILFWLETTLKS